MATKKEDIKMCCGHNSSILKCVGTKGVSNYYVSWSEFDDGLIKYCKECCDAIFKYYLEEYDDEKTALLYTLTKIDIPFIEQVYIDTIDKTNKFGNKVPLSVGSYIATLHKSQSNKNIYKDFSDTDCNIFELNTQGKTKEDKKNELNRLEKVWGIQDIEEDYDFLEETFSRYTEDINSEDLTPSRLDLYKDLCLNRLTLRKINDNRYTGEETIDKVQSRTAKIMSTLKIDQFEITKKKSDIEKILERQIWEIENTEPAELVDKEEYKDFLNIESEWGKHILRAVRNLLTGSKDFPKITKEK